MSHRGLRWDRLLFARMLEHYTATATTFFLSTTTTFYPFIDTHPSAGNGWVVTPQNTETVFNITLPKTGLFGLPLAGHERG